MACGRCTSAVAPHPQCARCPEKHSAYLLRRVLMSIKTCCRCKCHKMLHGAGCCKNGNIIMRQTLNCRSYLCPKLVSATRVATATASVSWSWSWPRSFRWPFPFGIGKKRSCMAAVRATRCGKLASWQVGGWVCWSICRLPLLSLSAIISVLLWQRARLWREGRVPNVA